MESGAQPAKTHTATTRNLAVCFIKRPPFIDTIRNEKALQGCQQSEQGRSTNRNTDLVLTRQMTPCFHPSFRHSARRITSTNRPTGGPNVSPVPGHRLAG